MMTAALHRTRDQFAGTHTRRARRDVRDARHRRRYGPDPVTVARLQLDAAVRAHFVAAPKPVATRALARAVRGDQREVELAVQRLVCPRLPGGLWGPPSNLNPGGQ